MKHTPEMHEGPEAAEKLATNNEGTPAPLGCGNFALRPILSA